MRGACVPLGLKSQADRLVPPMSGLNLPAAARQISSEDVRQADAHGRAKGSHCVVDSSRWPCPYGKFQRLLWCCPQCKNVLRCKGPCNHDLSAQALPQIDQPHTAMVRRSLMNKRCREGRWCTPFR
eukprot:7387136-Prymnesium_polylepis.1